MVRSLQCLARRADPGPVDEGLANLAKTLTRLDTIEDELSSLQEQVRHTDALATVGGLTAGLAHELNNILTPALGYAQLAERSPENSALVAKALRRTIESIQTATRILEATLDLASPSESKPDPDTSVGEALDAAIACLARDPANDGIEIRKSVNPTTVARITTQELQQVFVNLLTNATRELRRRKGGTITITAEPRNSVAHIEVADNGPGVSNEMRTRLFRPFATSESPQAGKPQQGGRGLGLAICHRTIAARRGTIDVDDAPGGGARFTIELPLVGGGGGDQAERPRTAA